MAIDPERVVFDAEPLVAHATDEPGAETVARYLRAIQPNECEGYCSVINLTELHSILSRESDPERADESVAWLETSGVTFLDAGECWRTGRRRRLHVQPCPRRFVRARDGVNSGVFVAHRW